MEKFKVDTFNMVLWVFWPHYTTGYGIKQGFDGGLYADLLDECVINELSDYLELELTPQCFNGWLNVVDISELWALEEAA